jgi:hypothetical protein
MVDVAELVSIKWRCTACGHLHDKDNHCESCGAPVCEKCHATNSMMSTKDWGRFVSDRKPLPYSQLRKEKTTTPSKKPKQKRKKRDAQTRISDLIKELKL